MINIQMDVSKTAPVPLNISDCAGTHDSPCSRDMSGTIYFSGDNFREGKSEGKVVASDALLRPSVTYTWPAYVDSTPPEVNLSGQLAAATKEENGDAKDPSEWDKLRLPVYNLTIEAEDGKKGSESTIRSGVKNIEVFLDNKTTPETVPWKAQSCAGPEYSCKMTVTYALNANALTAGKHRLKVFAVDQLGHKREREIEFEYIPATGMKDEYVMQHFPLPDGQGDEAEEEHPTRPELAVNVMNGNLVYREKDVDVEGYSADLEVERFYNSQLPKSQNTEWGDGWTLAQTPELKRRGNAQRSRAPRRKRGRRGRRAAADRSRETKFDPALQATVTKESGGGYALSDESGKTETTVAFDSNGQAEELAPGPTQRRLRLRAGKLDEIAIKDPASAPDLSAAEEEAFEYVPPAPSYKSAFGALGSADGQLKAPSDIALAPNGDLFVVDRSNNRIERINQEGKFVSKFGAEGTANGQFKRPCAIAIDPFGNLWVADADNNRIQKFNEKGEFLKAVGVRNRQRAVQKTRRHHHRSQRQRLGRRYLQLSGSRYSTQMGNSSLKSAPWGPAKASSTSRWESMSARRQALGRRSGLHRVSEFDAAGKLLRVFGSKGSSAGQFSPPEAIEVDSRGIVFVGDQSNNRVQEFSQAGKYLTQFGAKGPVTASSTCSGRWASPSTTWAASGSPTSATTGSRSGRCRTTARAGTAPSAPLARGRAAQSASRHRLCPQRRPLRRRQGQQPHRALQPGRQIRLQIRFLRHYRRPPFCPHLDRDRRLQPALGHRRPNNRVQVFTEDGKLVKAIGGPPGTGNGQFKMPEGIAADRKGHIYVADTYNQRVQVFDEEGKYLTKFGSADRAPASSPKPTRSMSAATAASTSPTGAPIGSRSSTKNANTSCSSAPRARALASSPTQMRSKPRQETSGWVTSPTAALSSSTKPANTSPNSAAKEPGKGSSASATQWESLQPQATCGSPMSPTTESRSGSSRATKPRPSRRKRPLR